MEGGRPAFHRVMRSANVTYVGGLRRAVGVLLNGTLFEIKV
jgi:hypothetical protein